MTDTSNGSLNGKGLALIPRTETKQTLKDFKSDQEVRWCPGCGDYAILAAVQSFLPELGLRRENIVFVSGIGCSSRFPYYLNTYGFHSIHGRAPAIATGLAASRPDLSVWVITGDGDALSIGGNHLIHGQYSPTSEIGKITKSTPMGSLDKPFNPISLALGAEAGFVARTIDSDRKHLQSVLKQAAEHRGASLVEIYQNCNIFNDGAFDTLKDPATRDEITIRLEHGQPIVFGTGDNERAVRLSPTGGVEVVRRAEVSDDQILVHDAHKPDPSLAFALSRLDEPAFEHVPIGVFRSIDRPSYDQLLNEQVQAATADKGAGSIADLLHGGDTWTIA